MVKVEVVLGLLVEVQTYLGTYLEEELETSPFPSPSHSRIDGNLDVVHTPLIGFVGTVNAFVCNGVKNRHRFIETVQDTFPPAQLCIVDLTHKGTNAIEVFLAGIACGDTSRQAWHLILRNLVKEADATHHIATIHTYGKVTAVLSYLSRSGEQRAIGNDKYRNNPLHPSWIHTFFIYKGHLGCLLVNDNDSTFGHIADEQQGMVLHSTITNAGEL